MAAQQVQYDHIEHIVRTTTQWNDAAIANFAIPRGVLCVEVLNNGTMKLKVGDGNKFYRQLPYIGGDGGDLSNYYTKEEVDRIITNLKAVTIPTTRIYPNKESLPIIGNKLGEIRFVNNPGYDPYTYMWNDTKWIEVGGAFDIDLSEYVKREEIMPRIESLERQAHTHPNKSILDQTTAPYTLAEKQKLSTLENYDDTTVKRDISDLKRQAHTHPNKSILDETTAPFTREEKTKLEGLTNYDDFIGTDGSTPGTHGLVPAPTTSDLNKFLSGDGTWKSVASGSIEPATADSLGGVKIGSGVFVTLDGTISVTIYEAFVGTDGTSAGTAGLVPAPTVADVNKFLSADGSWETVPSAYILPPATANSLGGVKIGSNVNVDANGTISVTPYDDTQVKSDITTLQGEAHTHSNKSILDNTTASYTIAEQTKLAGLVNYTLPIATSQVLGGVKIGSGVSIDQDGVISVAAYTLPVATSSVLGGVMIGSNINVDANGVISVAAPYSLPIATSGTLGGVKIGSNISIDQDGVISVASPYTLPIATSQVLGGVKIGNNINVDQDGVISVAAPYALPIATSSVLGGVKIGNNINVDQDGVISVAAYTLPVAASDTLGGIKVGSGLSIDQDGVLSASGSSYVLPVADASTLGGVKIGSNISIDSNGVISTHAPYTLPIAGASTLGGIKVGSGLSIDQDGILSTTVYTAGTGIDFIQTSQPSVITTDISDENWQNFAKYSTGGRDGMADNKTYTLQRLHIDPGTQFRLKFVSSGADTIYFNAAAFVNDTATSGGAKIIPADSSDWTTDPSIWYTMPDGRESLDISIRLNNPNYGSGSVISASSFYSMELEEKTNASGSYSINVVPATTTTLGGIIVGSNLSIDANGVLSATGGGSPYVLPIADASTLGGVKIGSNISIDANGVISVSAPYTLPIASANDLGGIKVGSGLSIDANGVLSSSGGGYTLPPATANTLGGVMIGSNISVDANGVISVASPYTLPIASANDLGGIKVGSGLSIDANGVLSSSGGGGYVLPIASDSTLGGIKVGLGLTIDSSTGVLDATEYIAGDGIDIQIVSEPIVVPIDISGNGWQNIVVTSGGSRNSMADSKTYMLMRYPVHPGDQFKLKFTPSNGTDVIYFNVFGFVSDAVTSGGVKMCPESGDWTTDQSQTITVPAGIYSIDFTIRLNNTGWGQGSVITAASFSEMLFITTEDVPIGSSIISVIPATTSTIGGVIVGAGLSVDQDGVLSVDGVSANVNNRSLNKSASQSQTLIYESIQDSTLYNVELRDLFLNWKSVLLTIQNVSYGSEAVSFSVVLPLEYIKSLGPSVKDADAFCFYMPYSQSNTNGNKCIICRYITDSEMEITWVNPDNDKNDPTDYGIYRLYGLN